MKIKKQIENATTVLNVIKILRENNFNITNDTILNSLSNIIHPGRFETISQSPLVIFDGAHNDNALSNFMEAVNSLYKDIDKTFIVSIIKTKDYQKMINTLFNNYPNSTFIFTSGNNEKKFFSKEALYTYANDVKNKLDLNVILKKDEIINIKNHISNNVNFIIGSFYVYNTVINLFK